MLISLRSFHSLCCIINCFLFFNTTCCASTSDFFYHDSVESYCRKLYHQYLENFIENLNNRLEQKNISLLVDAEDSLIFSLCDSQNLSTSKWEKKLKSEGVSHFLEHIVLRRLKWELMSARTQMGDKLNGDVDCFHDVLDSLKP